MTIEELTTNYPLLYHMAQPNTWPSIKSHGLMSTTALLDTCKISTNLRRKIESQRRPESISISHPKLGQLHIRDQKPMSESALKKCLHGMTPQEWYRLLNRKVYFWLNPKRLERLLNARAYRNQRHTILTLQADPLVQKYQDAIELAAINTGSTIFNPQPRGKHTFQPISDYDFQYWKTRRGRADAIVELTVNRSIPEIQNFVLRVEHRQANHATELLLGATQNTR